MKEWDSLITQMQANQITALQETNNITEKFGLTIKKEDAVLLMEERKSTLKEQGRVEFGEGILPKLIYTFCDSDYMDQENYVDTLCRLQEIFYLYKGESLEIVTDDELLSVMREQYEDVCFGDLDYLEGTCLKFFSEAVRAGYRGFIGDRTGSVYEQLDEVPRWDRELYLQTLKELCGE